MTDDSHWSRTRRRADAAYHNIFQTHLTEFRADRRGIDSFDRWSA